MCLCMCVSVCVCVRACGACACVCVCVCREGDGGILSSSISHGSVSGGSFQTFSRVSSCVLCCPAALRLSRRTGAASWRTWRTSSCPGSVHPSSVSLHLSDCIYPSVCPGELLYAVMTLFVCRWFIGRVLTCMRISLRSLHGRLCWETCWQTPSTASASPG